MKLLIDMPVKGQARSTDIPGHAPPGNYNETPCDKDHVFLESFDNTFVVEREVLREFKEKELC